MLRFKKFLIEGFVRPQFGINEPTRIQSPIKDRPLSIFTQSAGYGRDWGIDRGYNPRGDALVHTTEFFPEGGVIKTRGYAESNIPIKNWGVGPLSGRETIHFTRNGLVSSHLSGNWEGMPFTIIAPQGPMTQRLMAHADQDSWVLGNVEVPHGSTILVNEPTLTPQHKENLAKMFGVDNYEQIQQRLQKGSNLDFDGRQIEIKFTKGDVKKALEAQLRNVGIEPINIGSDYAVGPVDRRPFSKIPKRFGLSYGFSDAATELFNKTTKERLAALKSPFRLSPHESSGFLSAEKMATPPTVFARQNPSIDWKVPDQTLEDLVVPRIKSMGRNLHPEEVAALERNKNWRENLQQWINIKQEEYSTDPEAFERNIRAGEKQYRTPVATEVFGTETESAKPIKIKTTSSRSLGKDVAGKVATTLIDPTQPVVDATVAQVTKAAPKLGNIDIVPPSRSRIPGPRPVATSIGYSLAGLAGGLAGEYLVKPAAEKAGVFNVVERGTREALSSMPPWAANIADVGLGVAQTVFDPISATSPLLQAGIDANAKREVDAAIKAGSPSQVRFRGPKF